MFLRILKQLSVFGAFLLATSFFCAPFYNTSSGTHQYYLGTNSKLEINGETNINNFCCGSNERFTENKLSFQFSPDNSAIYFFDTRLKLDIYQMDCGGKIITKDFQKTLNAEQNPYIQLELKEAINQDCVDLEACDNWIFFQSKAEITLNSMTNVETLSVHVLKKNENMFQISGSKTIELSDYKIAPPSAMLGLIKVKNSITVNFDLEIVLI